MAPQRPAQQLPAGEQNNSPSVAGGVQERINLFFLVCHKHFLIIIFCVYFIIVFIYLTVFLPRIYPAAAFNHKYNFGIQMRVQDSKIQGSVT